MSKITNDGLTQSGTGCFIAVVYPHGNSGCQMVNTGHFTTDMQAASRVSIPWTCSPWHILPLSFSIYIHSPPASTNHEPWRPVLADICCWLYQPTTVVC